jgi:hypothetical protein
VSLARARLLKLRRTPARVPPWTSAFAS